MGVSTNLGLAGPWAKRPHGTLRAERLSREAAAAPMSLDEMRRERPLLFGEHVDELIVNLVGVVRAREAQALRDAEDVGIDRDGRLAERVAEDHVRGLEPDAGKRHEGVARARNFPAVLVLERLRHRDDRAGLRAIEAGRADFLLERGRLGPSVIACPGVLLEQSGRDHVHALVRALRREDRGDQELEWSLEVERDLGVWIGLLQGTDDLPGPGSLGVERLSHWGSLSARANVWRHRAFCWPVDLI